MIDSLSRISSTTVIVGVVEYICNIQPRFPKHKVGTFYEDCVTIMYKHILSLVLRVFVNFIQCMKHICIMFLDACSGKV